MLGRKLLQPAFSILASAMHVASLRRSGQRTLGHCRLPGCTKLLFALFRCRRPVVTPDFAHATVVPAIHESQLHPAFAPLLRIRLITPLSYFRGNHLEYLLCQGCHGKLLFVLLLNSTLFFILWRARQPRVWNARLRSSTPRPVEIIAARASITQVTFGTSLAPDFSSRGLAAFP